MVSKRRSFLKKSSILTGTILLGSSIDAVNAFSKNVDLASGSTFSILHTSGLCGQIAPAVGPLGGLRKIDQIFLRSNKNALKVDSGNFLNAGTEVQNHLEIIKQMNKMGYLASTIGENELGMGQEQLAEILPFVDFQLVNCNYDFSNSIISSFVKPYVIFNFGKVKIGITGAGNCKSIPGVLVKEPFQAVNETAKHLKKDLQCDLVVCLTQFNHNLKIYNDKKLAESSEYVDLIIGGEQDKVARNAYSLKNARQYNVMISQAGSKGKTVGELNYEFNQFNIMTNLTHKYRISGMNEYASLSQEHEVFQLLTATA